MTSLLDKVLLNQCVRLDEIINLDGELKDIVYHNLYYQYKHDELFLKHNSYTKTIEMCRGMDAESRLKIIQTYSKYPMLYGVRLIHHHLRSMDKDDVKEYLRSAPETKYLTKSRKKELLYQTTGVIDLVDANDADDHIIKNLKLIQDIIENIDELKYLWRDYEQRYLDLNPARIDLPHEELRFVQRFSFFSLCRNLSLKLNLDKECVKMFFRLSSEFLGEFTDIPNLSNLRKAMISQLYATIERRIVDPEKKRLYRLYVLDETIIRFKEKKEIWAFYDILCSLNNLKLYDRLIEFFMEHMNLMDIVIRSPYLFDNIMPVVSAVLVNIDPERGAIVMDRWYNEIMRFVHSRKPIKSPFLLQKATSSELALKDINDESTCIICLDIMKIDDIVLMCVVCKRYVGHHRCYAGQSWQRCPHCRS